MQMRAADRRWWQQGMLLASFALLLRILIPSGWMPAADRVGLMPCFGTVAATTMHSGGMADHAGDHLTGRHGSNGSGHSESDKGDRPCAFVGFACALAEPDGLSAPLPAFRPASILLAALAQAPAIGAGLAAPPPPPTGPPATF
jgi:hypothetical protein